MIAFILSLFMFILGPVLYEFFTHSFERFAHFDRTVFLIVGIFILLHIVPECWEILGPISLIPFAIGLIVPSVIERWMSNLEQEMDFFVVFVIIAGIGLHVFIDGLTLGHYALISPSATSISILPIGIILHRLPEGVLVWRMLLRTRVYAIVGLSCFALATALGFYLSYYLGIFHAHHEYPWIQMLTAGSILHVVFHSKSKHLG